MAADRADNRYFTLLGISRIRYVMLVNFSNSKSDTNIACPDRSRLSKTRLLGKTLIDSSGGKFVIFEVAEDVLRAVFAFGLLPGWWLSTSITLFYLTIC